MHLTTVAAAALPVVVDYGEIRRNQLPFDLFKPQPVHGEWIPAQTAGQLLK